MRESSVGNNLTPGSKTTVFTVPDKTYAKWILLYLTNNGASTKYVSVYWYDSSTATEIEIYNQLSITSKSTVRLDNGFNVALESGDQIRIQPEAASTITAVNTFELIPARASALT